MERRHLLDNVESSDEEFDEIETGRVTNASRKREQRFFPKGPSTKEGDKASIAASVPGGIDFNRAKMRMNVQKEGNGAQMQFDPAAIERIRRDGFDGVDFEVQSIIPVTNLPLLLGLRKEEIEAQTQLAAA